MQDRSDLIYWVYGSSCLYSCAASWTSQSMGFLFLIAAVVRRSLTATVGISADKISRIGAHVSLATDNTAVAGTVIVSICHSSGTSPML